MKGFGIDLHAHQHVTTMEVEGGSVLANARRTGMSSPGAGQFERIAGGLSLLKIENFSLSTLGAIQRPSPQPSPVCEGG